MTIQFDWGVPGGGGTVGDQRGLSLMRDHKGEGV